MTDRERGELAPRLDELERLIREMEDGPESPTRARARRIVGAALDLHAAALARMLDIVGADDGAGRAFIDAFAADPLVSGLLILHGLHPLGLETRVRAAVENLALALRSQGARPTLVVVVDGAVRVRVEREAASGGLPAAALRARIEEAILAAAPDAASVAVDVPADADHRAFVPVEQVRLRSRAPEVGRG